FSAPERLDECVERGYVCSFAGNVTYPKATDLQEAARRLPAALLLVETDSPYLAPQPVRGRPNEPANVAHTARFVAELRGVEYEELERTVEANAERVCAPWAGSRGRPRFAACARSASARIASSARTSSSTTTSCGSSVGP